jgi:hypothetical protein
LDHGASAAFTAAPDTDDSLAAGDQVAISHRNAQALFPGWQPTRHHHSGAPQQLIATAHIDP